MDALQWQDYADLYQATLTDGGLVLVIDDDQERSGVLSMCLWALAPFGVRALATAGALAAAVDEVELVLVNMGPPYAGRLAAAVRVVAAHPGSMLIGYGAAEEDEGAREALHLAGAREPLPFPIDPQAFIAAVRAARLHARKQGPVPFAPQLPEEDTSIIKLVAVFSPKGGVGTSTLAVNLAAALADSGIATALMDGDLEFASHHVFLDLPPGRSILWCMEDNAPDISSEGVEEALTTHASGLRALLAPPQPELSEGVLPGHLRRIVKLLRTGNRITIVDAGSGGDRRTWAMLNAADVVLVPIVPERPALKLFEEVLRQAPVHGIHPGRLIPILMRANSLPPSAILSIESLLRRPLPWRIRSDGLRVLASITEGVPFVLGSPESPLSREVQALAACLPMEDALSRLQSATPPESAPVQGAVTNHPEHQGSPLHRQAAAASR